MAETLTGSGGTIYTVAEVSHLQAEIDAAIANAKTSAAMLTALGVTSYEMAGLAASNGASTENPVATMADIPVVPEIPSQTNMPTSDQKAALSGTSGTPSASNPYATKATTDLKANTDDLGSAAVEDADAFATAAQGALADSALQPNDTRLAPTGTLFVDGTRTDTYTANGSTSRPYKDFTALVTRWGVLAAPITVNAATASYSAGGSYTVPNYPLTLYANGSTLTSSGTFTTQNTFTAYDLNTDGNVAIGAGSVHTRYNGSITGTLTVSGTCCLRNVTVSGLVTVNAGGTLCYDETCRFLGGIKENGGGGAFRPTAEQTGWHNICSDSGCGLGSGFAPSTVQATPTVTVTSALISFTAATATIAHSGSGFGSVVAGDFFVVTGSTGNNVTGNVTTAAAGSLVCSFGAGDTGFADEAAGATITIKFYRYSASTWFAPRTALSAGKITGWFLFDNTTNGGTRGALNTLTRDLITAQGKPATPARYSKEFGLVSFDIVASGGLFGNSTKSAHGRNETVSAGFWVYHTNPGTVTIGAGFSTLNQFYSLNGGDWVNLSGSATLTIPASTWTHVILTEKNVAGYNGIFPSVQASASGGAITIAQWFVAPGRVPLTGLPPVNPVKSYVAVL